jgi:riboflavin kinase/FMN adenylyltransferase
MSGKVIPGRKIGRQLGYPTANIEPLDQLKLIPRPGVYAALLHLDQVTFEAMLYIGTRPTFNANEKGISIEAHVLGFDKEIYGESVDVDIIEYIRDDLTLENAEALSAERTDQER